MEQATISTNDGPKYDTAYLEELKASTPTTRPPQPSVVDVYDADMSIDMGDVSVQSLDNIIGAVVRFEISTYLDLFIS